MERAISLEKSHTKKVSLQKSELREHYLKLLKALPRERREKASRALLESLKPKLAPFSRILSFESFSYEIDLSLVNSYIASHKTLFLAKWEGGDTLIVHEAKKGGQKIELHHLDCILVPGVAFDATGARIGHGKGCYDRFLLTHPEAYTIGVGFKEQFSKNSLPQESHDRRVQECLLV
jgi:5-formyltetrahydrofolate cyclo-ligase